MTLYDISKDTKLDRIKEKAFKLERDLQELTETNLETILSLKFICSEFALNQFRIDTLAFDSTNNSFVIIEYKRDKNFSVIDQGYAYLALMLNNKADFILEYNEKMGKGIGKKDIDWSQSKVIFISQSFTTYQREAINFKDLPIELWKAKRYENNTVSFTQITNAESNESINAVTKKGKIISNVNKEIKVYTDESHLGKASSATKELYEQLKESILNLGEVKIKHTKTYIAFISATNVIDLVIQKNAIKAYLNLKIGKIDDPKNIARDVSNIGTWGNGDYEISMNDDSEIDYVMTLVKQSYQKNSS